MMRPWNELRSVLDAYINSPGAAQRPDLEDYEYAAAFDYLLNRARDAHFEHQRERSDRLYELQLLAGYVVRTLNAEGCLDLLNDRCPTCPHGILCRVQSPDTKPGSEACRKLHEEGGR